MGMAPAIVLARSKPVHDRSRPFGLASPDRHLPRLGRTAIDDQQVIESQSGISLPTVMPERVRRLIGLSARIASIQPWSSMHL
jgi:hypothetical protein